MSTSTAQKSGSAALAITALGVVFGDIGTSPLYALRETFEFAHLEINEQNVYGLLSLVVWSLIIVICLKYLWLIMRADNQGEGGEPALLALLGDPKKLGKVGLVLAGLGTFGTALLYGDGVITPAISVLAAVEGLDEVPALRGSVDPYIIPLTIVILIALFSVQRKGTAKIGGIFGPTMIVWFTTLGLLGIIHLVKSPEILKAVSPHFAIQFFIANELTSFIALGTIFLVVTGGEALYADLGHFGRKPIAQSWFIFVFPGLLLNYFGQGAFLLANRDLNLEENSPFFLLAPDWARLPLVILATLASIIASQALISGAFSLTLQAVRMELMPRLKIIHTSDKEQGQIYVPAVNWALMVGSVGLVLGFRSASNLAAAYGIAVAISMVVSTSLFFVVCQKHLGFSKNKAIALLVPIFIVDLAFFSANTLKIPDGGWFPLVVGVLLVIVMTTWKKGRQIIRERLHQNAVPVDKFLETLNTKEIQRTDGTAGVFLAGQPDYVPPALISDLRHHKVLPEDVYLLNISVEPSPTVLEAKRVKEEDLGHGFHRLLLRYGFREPIDVHKALKEHSKLDAEFLNYVIGRESIVVTDKPGMAKWRERLYVTLYRNTTSASRYFGLPIEKTTESGQSVEL